MLKTNVNVLNRSGLETLKQAHIQLVKAVKQQGHQLADLQRQVSKRSLILHGPDVLPKKTEETEQQTFEIFVDLVNTVFKILIEKKDIAACHRQGNVRINYFKCNEIYHVAI